ncbi:MAG: ABC transporter substrate-binding protein [bacterium]|nr:ABC transporter substrate-binding protein [bacterium]
MRHKALLVVFSLLMLSVNSIIAADPGITNDQILLGSSLPLEGSASFLGIQTSHGLMAYINYVNEHGGVNGRKINVKFYNDNYDPLTCVLNTKKLLEQDKVFALTCYVGTPTAVKAQPVWVNAKVPVVGFFTGAEVLRNPLVHYNIHIRASYYEEAKVIIDYFVNELKFKKIAVFYQYDAFGEAVKKGTEIALEKYGITPVGYGSFDRNTVNIEEGLKKIKNTDPEAVIMVGTYDPLSKFVKEAKKNGMSKTIFHTVSFVGPEALKEELGKDTENVIVTQVMPPYTDINMILISQYLTFLKKSYPQDSPSFVSLEGFVNAVVLVEGLKKAGKTLTREGLIDAVENIKSLDIGGVTISYGADDHVGLNRVWITKIQDGKFVGIKNWQNIGK